MCLDAAGAYGGLFSVTNTDDSGTGSLRQAILDVNAMGDSMNTIEFLTLDDASFINLLTPLDPLRFDADLVASQVVDLTVDGNGDTYFSADDMVDVTFTRVGHRNGIIQIGNDGILTFDESQDLVIESSIEDELAAIVGGALVKDGTATLTLTGDNDYKGGTTIREGLLIVDIDSLPGLGGTTIDSLGALEFVQDDFLIDRTFSDVIGGAGDFVKSGTGNLIFTRTHTFTGETRISAGTLTIGAGGALAQTTDLVIESGGTLVLDSGLPIFHEGLLDGTGILEKRGDTNLTLNGGGAFSGTARAVDGTIVDASNALTGRVELLNDSVLAFTNTTAGTLNGSISGTGSVEKDGTGTKTLRGSNSYSGGTTIFGGTLVGDAGSLQGDITIDALSPATLEFNQLLPGTFTGDVAVDGDGGDNLFLKSGIGVLTLPGTVDMRDPMNGATGIVNVEAGGLDVNGTLTAARINVIGGTLGGTGSIIGDAVTVASGGTLGGTPTVMGPVTVQGTVAAPPSAPAGAALDVDSIAFQSGSTLQVQIGENDFGSKVVATSATVGSGATLRTVLEPGVYTEESVVEVLSAASNINQLFANPGLGSAFIDVTQRFKAGDPTTIELRVGRNDATISDYAFTRNQTAVARVLDNGEASASGDMVRVYENIFVSGPLAIPGFLDQVAGESYTQFVNSRIAIGERTHRTLHRRARDRSFGQDDPLWRAGLDSGGPALAAAPPQIASASPLAGAPELLAIGARSASRSARPSDASGLGVWLDGYGIVSHIDGDVNAASSHYDVLGTTLGLDQRLGEHWVIGGAVGYAHTDLDLEGRTGDGRSNTFQGALYGGWSDPMFHVTASGRFAWTNNQSNRWIAFGQLFRKAQGEFGTSDFGGRVEAGVNLLTWSGISLRPLAAFDYGTFRRGTVREKGAGSLNLWVDPETIDSLLSTVGLEIDGRITIDDETSFVPTLRAFWLHEFGDTERVARSRLAGAPAAGSFAIIGAEAPRDSMLLGVGWAASLGEDLQVLADYDVLLDRARLDHNLTLTFRVHF